MSIKLITEAWNSEAEGNALLTLIALCDYANDEGELFPSLATIMKKTKVSKSNLAYILNAFEEIGVIERERRVRENGSDTSSFYRILNLNFSKQDYIKAYQKAKGYIPKTPQSGHPNIPKVDTLKHPKVDTLKHPKVDTQTPQSGHLEPSILNRHKKNTKKKIIKNRHTDINFKLLITKLNEKALFRNKIENSDEEYQEYLRLEDTSNLFEDYLEHQTKEKKYAIKFLKFLKDYSNFEREEVRLWA